MPIPRDTTDARNTNGNMGNGPVSPLGQSLTTFSPSRESVAMEGMEAARVFHLSFHSFCLHERNGNTGRFMSLPYPLPSTFIRRQGPLPSVARRMGGKGRVRVCAARGRAATPVLRPVPPAVESPFGDPVRYDRA